MFKEDFAAILAHEMRSPLTIIQGYAETLPENEAKGKILSGCSRLEKLLRGLLTLSNLQHHPEKVDLLEIAERCKKAVMETHPQAEIALVGVNEMIEADPFLLEIAIQNLLENGIKYGSNKIEIKVGEGSISVTDDGMGIPESEIPKIFNRFYAIDRAKSRKLGGVGLGLAIVKGIVELHQGRVEVVSTVGKGSCFTLFFNH
jgi:two-component system phosphate regulon sensor histidine kinase PhoR